MAHDYSQFQTKMSDDDLGKLSRLIVACYEKEREVAEAEADLKLVKEAHKQISEHEIPELMDKLGIREFTTDTGLKVAVKESLQGNISAANRQRAHKWLEDHGYGGLIKRSIVVAFNREQQDEAAELMKRLAQEFPNVKDDTKVAAPTLKAWVRERMKAGEEVDMQLFGVHEVRQAKIKTIS